RAHLAVVEEAKHLERFVSWSQRFPLEEMRHLEWISPQSTGVSLVRELISFFGLASPLNFDPLYALDKNYFRKSAKYQVDERALIQLSLRYKRNDVLWFTFFHEAGHILLHGKKELFVESDARGTNQKEREADVFSADMLIPPQRFRDFMTASDFTKSAVEKF